MIIRRRSGRCGRGRGREKQGRYEVKDELMGVRGCHSELQTSDEGACLKQECCDGSAERNEGDDKAVSPPYRQSTLDTAG